MTEDTKNLNGRGKAVSRRGPTDWRASTQNEAKEMGHKLAARRKKLNRDRRGGYRQVDVAKRLGISLSGYAHYESGINQIPTTTLSKVAEILEVPVAYFFDEVTENHVESNNTIAAYNGLPESAKRLVDNLVRELAQIFGNDDASPHIHPKVIGTKS